MPEASPSEESFEDPLDNPRHDRLRGRIEALSARVGIIGLGYVGLPLALAFAETGFPVLGFDADPEKVEALRTGRRYIRHLDEGLLRRTVERGRFEPTADAERLGEPDALLICVPTPLSTRREPDLTAVESTTRQIAAALR
ncbi:MAG: NAD(P)-binding domain-containing protein, partial [Acidobacteriota bacterium]